MIVENKDKNSSIGFLDKAEKVVMYLAWTSVLATLITLICVFLSTHNIIYIKILNNYYALQIVVSVTMVLWGIKFAFDKESRTRVVY
ncbi:MAG: hypothetical protein AB2369_03545, partial [Clostridium sp.]